MQWTDNGNGMIVDSEGDVCTNVREGCGSLIAAAPLLLEALVDAKSRLKEWTVNSPH